MKINYNIPKHDGCVKEVLRGTFIAINAYIRKNVEISNKQCNFIPLELENEEYKVSSASRRKEIRSRTEIINEIETEKYRKSMKIRVSYFERNKNWEKRGFI